MRPDGSDVRTVTSGGTRLDGAPAASADGRKITFERYDVAAARDLGLFVLRLGGGKPQHVPGTGTGDCCPAFGPDNQTIVFTRSRPMSAGPVIRTIRLDGSHARRLVDTYGAADPSFAPDGKSIIFSRDGYLYRIRPDGTHLHRLPGTLGAFSASFSPNGHRIVFAANPDLYILRLSDNHVRQLTADAAQERSPEFSPSGKRIVFGRVESEAGDDSRVGTWVIRDDGSHEHRIRAKSLVPLAWQPLPR
jgi:Tol biopolymer transport system component